MKIRKILSKIKLTIKNTWTWLLSFIRKYNLKNRDFTIISNNCWGGFVYRRYNLPYKTPFLGLFIPAPCYIEMLEKFDYYMSLPLKFINLDESQYYGKIIKNGIVYPIGLLGDSVEVHFLHYSSKEEAIYKWEKRKKRIDKNNMLVKFSEMDCCTPELIECFDKLPFENKICFCINVYSDLRSVRLSPHKPGETEVKDDLKNIPSDLTVLLNNLTK